MKHPSFREGSDPSTPLRAHPPHHTPTRPPLSNTTARATRGFTLLEVVLALSIAIGLLSVVLYFYQQIARLRDATLADTSRLAAVRLSMDRLASELRTASGRPGSFRGTAQEIEFVRCTLADPGPGMADRSTNRPAGYAPRSPCRRIAYRLSGTNDLGEAASVERTEEPDEPTRISTLPLALDDLLDAPSSSTNTSAPSQTTFVVIPELRHLTLRYWDGSAWQESWAAPQLPRGVEITLSAEAPSATATPETSIQEIFRRVVAIPSANSSDDATGLASPSATGLNPAAGGANSTGLGP